MAIDFSIEPEFQTKLDWMDRFVTEEVEPLDLYFRDTVSPFDRTNATANALVHPLQRQVQEQDLWACHLGPELGGPGYGQVKLALMNEILGRSLWGQIVFGCQAPTPATPRSWPTTAPRSSASGTCGRCWPGDLVHLLDDRAPGRLRSQLLHLPGGAGRRRVGHHRREVVRLQLPLLDVLIVMVITNPDVPVYRGSSMVLVPSDAEGLEVVTDVGLGSEPLGEGDHPHLRFNDVRVPAENLLGEQGSGFKIAQTRLGGGRVHHAMRSVGTAQRALDMMCERVLSRETKGSLIAEKQAIQHWIADSWVADPAVPLTGVALRLADRRSGRLRQDPPAHRRSEGGYS